MIAPTAIIRGVGLTFGMDLIDEVDGMTGYYDSNLGGKMTKGAECLIERDYDFGFIHIKAVDDAGHDKDLNRKIEQLSKADVALEKLVRRLGETCEEDYTREFILVVTGDHTTPISYGDHTHEPVVFAMGQVSKLYRTIKNKEPFKHTFDEIHCGSHHARLGRFTGMDIMPMLKRFRNSLLHPDFLPEEELEPKTVAEEETKEDIVEEDQAEGEEGEK